MYNKQNTFEKLTILFQNIKDQTMSTTGYLTLVGILSSIIKYLIVVDIMSSIIKYMYLIVVGIMSSIIKYLIAKVLLWSQSPTFFRNNIVFWQFTHATIFINTMWYCHPFCTKSANKEFPSDAWVCFWKVFSIQSILMMQNATKSVYEVPRTLLYLQ